MSTSSTIILTTGQPGSGKSYSRVRWLVTDFLINETGVFITNLPLNRGLIAVDLSAKTGKPLDYYLGRLVVIDRDELRIWENLQNETKEELKRQREERNFIPFEFFKRFDLQNAHIAIDEFHLYFSVSSPLPLRQCWNDFFAEIRKLGCTFEAITQDLSLIPKDFVGKVGTRFDHLPFGNTRDPFLGVLMSDWYELRTGFSGKSEQKICCIEYIKGTSFTGGVKWKRNGVERFNILPEIYKYYNSYQRNDTGETGKRVTPGQRLGRRVVWWFLRRNFFRLFGKFILVLVVLWLLAGGGLVWSIQAFMSMLQGFANSNSVPKTEMVASAPVPSSVAVPLRRPLGTASSSIRQLEHASAVYDGAGEAVQPPPVNELDSYKPAMFMETEVWLRNGMKINNGYKFEEGLLNGRTVSKIFYGDRCYLLDDGRRIYMY